MDAIESKGWSEMKTPSKGAGSPPLLPTLPYKPTLKPPKFEDTPPSQPPRSTQIGSPKDFGLSEVQQLRTQMAAMQAQLEALTAALQHNTTTTQHTQIDAMQAQVEASTAAPQHNYNTTQLQHNTTQHNLQNLLAAAVLEHTSKAGVPSKLAHNMLLEEEEEAEQPHTMTMILPEDDGQNLAHSTLYSAIRNLYNLRRDNPKLFKQEPARYTADTSSLIKWWHDNNDAAFAAVLSSLQNDGADIEITLNDFIATARTWEDPGYALVFHAVCAIFLTGRVHTSSPFAKKCVDMVDRVLSAFCRWDSSLGVRSLLSAVQNGTLDESISDPNSNLAMPNLTLLSPQCNSHYDATYRTVLTLIVAAVKRLATDADTVDGRAQKWQNLHKHFPAGSTDISLILIKERELWKPYALAAGGAAPREFERVDNLLSTVTTDIRTAFHKVMTKRGVERHNLTWDDSVNSLRALTRQQLAAVSYISTNRAAPVPTPSPSDHSAVLPSVKTCPVHPLSDHGPEDCKIIKQKLGMCGNLLFLNKCEKTDCRLLHDDSTLIFQGPTYDAAVCSAVKSVARRAASAGGDGAPPGVPASAAKPKFTVGCIAFNQPDEDDQSDLPPKAGSGSGIPFPVVGATGLVVMPPPAGSGPVWGCTSLCLTAARDDHSRVPHQPVY